MIITPIVDTGDKMKLQTKAFLCVACSVFLLGLSWTSQFDQELSDGALEFQLLLQETEEAEIMSLRGSPEWRALAVAGSDDQAILPVGDYEFPSSHTSTPTDAEAPARDYGRVLLYITSHWSGQHALYLKYCWKNLLARSPMLQQADVAVYLNPNEANVREPAVNALKDVFQENDLKVYVRSTEPLDGGPWRKGHEITREARVKKSGAIEAVQGKSSLDSNLR